MEGNQFSPQRYVIVKRFDYRIKEMHLRKPKTDREMTESGMMLFVYSLEFMVEPEPELVT